MVFRRNPKNNKNSKKPIFSYLGVTLGKHQEHAVDPYDRAAALRRKENELHKAKTKGGPFKLNSHPKDVFDPKIYEGFELYLPYCSVQG